MSFGRLIHRYAAAVLAASLGFLVLLELTEIFRSVSLGARPHSLVERAFETAMLLPLLVTFVAIGDLLGFLGSILLASQVDRAGWWFFLVAGRASGAFAWLLLSRLVGGGPEWTDPLALVSYAATGAIGGLAFWAVAARLDFR